MGSKIVSRPVVYLPVETSSRELDSRLLIAASEFLREVYVVIGPSNALRRISGKFPGVYLHKRHTLGDKSLLGKLVEDGNLAFAIDEEALAFEGNLESWASESTDPSVVGLLTRIFANTKEQFDSLHASQGLRAGLVVKSGNPRIELANSSFKFTRLGDLDVSVPERFVLVNTTFSTGNFSKTYGISTLEHRRRLNKIAGVDDRESSRQFELLRLMDERESKLFEAYVEMLRLLAESNPRLTFVLRPHPTEDLRTWRSAVGEMPNVFVTRKGNVLPYIERAICVIHPGCTTALEANLLGVPTIYFDPLLNSFQEFPDHYGPHAKDMDELAGELGRVLRGPDSQNRAAPERARPGASDLIARELANFALKKIPGTRLAWLLAWAFGISAAYELVPIFRRLFSRNLGALRTWNLLSATHSKFPWQDPRKVRSKFELLSGASRGSIPNSEKRRNVLVVGPRTFVISPR